MHGSVVAGFPSPAEEELSDQIDINDWINNIDACYMLTICGNSMQEAGIMNGDYVIIERKEKYEAGDIVVAVIDGAYTIKFLRKDKQNQYYLQAANDSMDDIYPGESLEIDGKLRTVVRKYD